MMSDLEISKNFLEVWQGGRTRLLLYTHEICGISRDDLGRHAAKSSSRVNCVISANLSTARYLFHFEPFILRKLLDVRRAWSSTILMTTPNLHTENSSTMLRAHGLFRWMKNGHYLEPFYLSTR